MPLDGIPGLKISCLQCRAAKRRCHNTDTGHPCARCKKQDLICEYKEHRRGRRSARQSEGSLHSVHTPSSADLEGSNPGTSGESFIPLRSTPSSADGRAIQSPNATVKTIRFSHLVSINGSSWPSNERGDEGPRRSPFTPLQPTNAEDISREHLVIERLLSSTCLDPVQAGVLTQSDAVDLFELYFASLNLLVPILDPVLCSPTNCQLQCPLLFTAVLTITSKVLRPKAYRSCLLLANKLMGQAFEQAQCSISIIQAIHLLVHFKEPEDESGWRRIGYAIRMAIELRIHIFHQAKVRESVEEKRNRLNGERTWINLLISDYHMAIHHSLPRMIADDGIEDVDAWVDNHANMLIRGENFLPMLIGFSRLCRLYADLIEGMNGSASNLRLLSWIERKWQHWRRRYLRLDQYREEEQTYKLEQLQSATLQLCDSFFGFHIAEYKLLFAVRYQSKANSEDILAPSKLSFAFNECVEAALGPSHVFAREYVPHLLLPYASNIFWVALAVTSVWLASNLHFMDTECRQEVLKIFYTVQKGCQEASRTPADLPAYMYRLLQHLLSGQEGIINTAPSTMLEDLLSFTRPGEESVRRIIQENLYNRPFTTTHQSIPSNVQRSQDNWPQSTTPSRDVALSVDSNMLFPSNDDEFWKLVFPVSDVL